MKNKMTICPPINGIGGLTDMEVFACFNIEIDEQGNDLWEFRKIPKKQKTAREKRADLISPDRERMIKPVGRAGSLERIEALAKHYQTTDEVTPFHPFR